MTVEGLELVAVANDEQGVRESGRLGARGVDA